MKWKTRFACRCRPFRGLGLALFALFSGFATAAQAMLLTLSFFWEADENTLQSTYHLQKDSIIQVIGYHVPNPDAQGANNVPNTVAGQFGAPYGSYTGPEQSAEPVAVGETPDYTDVYLADNTPVGHSIVYTGSVQEYGSSLYGLYTQVTIDTYLYNMVYIRVFGATSIEQGQVTASFWGVTNQALKLSPTFQTQTYGVTNLVANEKNYFEVIPEPTTLGLLGLGGCALAAWRRRRLARSEAGMPVRMEE